MGADSERDTRESMIEAARDLMVSGGFEALSMRKVGQAVGVSATAIYRHFEDKDAVLSAAVIQGARLFGSYLRDALREPTPWARLERMGQRYFDFAEEHRQDYYVLFMLDCEQSGMEKLDQIAKLETRSTFTMLVDRICECQAAGVLRAGDPNALAVYVWSSYHGLASLRGVGRIGGSAEEYQHLVRAQLELTLSALCVPPLPQPAPVEPVPTARR